MRSIGKQWKWLAVLTASAALCMCILLSAPVTVQAEVELGIFGDGSGTAIQEYSLPFSPSGHTIDGGQIRFNVRTLDEVDFIEFYVDGEYFAVFNVVDWNSGSYYPTDYYYDEEGNYIEVTAPEQYLTISFFDFVNLERTAQLSPFRGRTVDVQLRAVRGANFVGTIVATEWGDLWVAYVIAEDAVRGPLGDPMPMYIPELPTPVISLSEEYDSWIVVNNVTEPDDNRNFNLIVFVNGDISLEQATLLPAHYMGFEYENPVTTFLVDPYRFVPSAAGTYDIEIIIFHHNNWEQLNWDVGMSGRSNTLSFTPQDISVPAPAGFTLNGSVLSWTAVPDASNYHVSIQTYNPESWSGWDQLSSAFPDDNFYDLSTLRGWVEGSGFVPFNWEENLEYLIDITAHTYNPASRRSGTSVSQTLRITYPFSVTGGDGSAPGLSPTPPRIPSGATAELVTTENLVRVIPPSPTAGQDLRYTVQGGETLWSIAFNYYGSMQAATVNRIFNANRDIIPANQRLTAGMVLTLPAQGLRQPVMQDHLSAAAGMYLVQAGDTLASIALHFYGDATQWRRIREANSPRVGTNNIIYAGQWLVIPE
jgi:phage tail protein X